MNKYTSVVVVIVITYKYVVVDDCIDAAVVVADKNTFVLDTVVVVVGKPLLSTHSDTIQPFNLGGAIAFV